MSNVAVFGSTGSIGRTTLSIVRKYPRLFRVRVLSAGRNIGLLRNQVKEFSPGFVAVMDEGDAQTLRQEFPKIKFFSGPDGLSVLSQLEGLDLIVMAILGLDALMPSYLALKAHRKVALASKEVMVAAGSIIKTIKDSDDLLIPVDSEHSAIYQLLRHEDRRSLKRIILTASGGPFLNIDRRRFKSVTPSQALNHPKWKMGRKITIDSATMMNKGLELIEAKWLFNLKPSQIAVTIHPQSIIHSMVEFIDGAVLAQMGAPDMKLPISYAMNMRERLNIDTGKLDFTKIGSLHFIPPDLRKFRCLKIAMDVLREDNKSAVAMNAANDVAVDAFLRNRISFTDIPVLIEYAVDRHYYKSIRSIHDVLAVDREVKIYVRERIKKLC
jgi:1-deoxy-D-xylulose-5-phosphate reductoisomerase